MKVALLVTGEIRTLEKTWKLILDHIIAPNEADVFIYGQKQAYDKHELPFAQDQFHQYWGSAVKSIKFMSLEELREYNLLSQYLYHYKPAFKSEVFARSGVNKEYLLQSGTLIEHYQIWRCGQMILQYEQQNQIKYDLVMRIRLDSIFIHPFECKAFYEGWSKSIPNQLMNRINPLINASAENKQEEQKKRSLEIQNKVLVFLQCAGHESMFEECEKSICPAIQDWAKQPMAQQTLGTFIKAVCACAPCNSPPCVPRASAPSTVESSATESSTSDTDKLLKDVSTQIAYYELLTEFYKGNFVHAFRRNVVWLVNRLVFLNLYCLFWSLGEYDDGDRYTWNAESQFIQHIQRHGFRYIDYHPAIQDHYLVSRKANLSVLSVPSVANQTCQAEEVKNAQGANAQAHEAITKEAKKRQQAQVSQISKECDQRLVFTIIRPNDYQFDAA